MFDKSILKEILTRYKKDFSSRWEKEKFKWEAVKHFQDNWDIEALDFTNMLEKSLEKTKNILSLDKYYPYMMINEIAKKNPENIKKMYIELFDEKVDKISRIDIFKEKIEKIYHKDDNHYQKEHAISTYLWLRYPDKYYIYKFNIVKEVANRLKSDYIIKSGDYKNNLSNFYNLYDEICEEIKKDDELIELFRFYIKSEDTCYQDNEYKTLTIDICWYIKENEEKKDNLRNKEDEEEEPDNDWFPSYYSPGLSIKDWVNLLNDKEVFNVESLEIMKRMKDFGGQATCKDLANKYGESINFYNNKSSSLARRIIKKTDCQIMKRDTRNSRWWPVLYVGKHAPENYSGEGVYIWKLREELSKALDEVDLSQIKLYSANNDLNNNKKYSKEDFLSEVYVSEDFYDELANTLERKKNIILQGAPGVGKTFIAKRLAYSIVGEKDKDRIEFVQFHQNYYYEDFVMGYKPEGDSFKLKYGIFYNFSNKAKNNPNKKYFFIIDEINRGNISKIFGELLMLIEYNYRGEENKIKLAYNDNDFYVPKNLYIIGMMNIADRSLAIIDYALRRRFSFFDIKPSFDEKRFKEYKEKLKNEHFDKLIDEIIELNEEIKKDESLGEGFCIGHSYFCNLEVKNEDDYNKKIKSIIKYDILPMLKEYWFDDKEKLKEWQLKLEKL